MAFLIPALARHKFSVESRREQIVVHFHPKMELPVLIRDLADSLIPEGESEACLVVTGGSDYPDVHVTISKGRPFRGVSDTIGNPGVFNRFEGMHWRHL